MRNIKFVFGFLIIFISILGHKAYAEIEATFNYDASQSQNLCVIDVGVGYINNQNYVPESGYVKISLNDGSFNKTVPLDGYTSVLDAYTVITTPLPEKTRSYTVTSEFYVDTFSGDKDVRIVTEIDDVVCENPTYKEKQEQNEQILKQQAGNKITQTIYTAGSNAGSSQIQFGNRSFDIGGIGAALSGCLGIGNKITSQLGSLFGGGGSDDAVGVDDQTANQKETCGDSLAYAASRVLIKNISKSVLNWATTGNNGNPFFPTNYSSLFNNIKNDQARNFVYELQNSATNNPYSQNFARSFAFNIRNQNQSFTERTRYTGPDARFFQDFRNGGWDSWFKFLEPQNNSLGYSNLASKEASGRQNEAETNARQELANNQGFISWKECADKGYVAWKDDADRAKTQAAASAGDKASQARVEQATCKNWKTVTPGSIISDQLSTVLNSPIRQAEQIDEVDEALGRVFEGIVANLVNKGLSSLGNNDFKNSINFTFNNPWSQNDGYDYPTGGTFWDEYNSNFDLRKELPRVIKIQKTYVDQVTKNAKTIGLVLNSIDRMDYALPGPRVGWDEGIREKIYGLVADLKSELIYQTGGVLGNILSLGTRDKIVENTGQVFLEVFTFVFDEYSRQIYEKFDPASKVMPENSLKMYGLIKGRDVYVETLQKTADDVTRMQDIVDQLEDINDGVIALYKKACARFLKENPGSTCI